MFQLVWYPQCLAHRTTNICWWKEWTAFNKSFILLTFSSQSKEVASPMWTRSAVCPHPPPSSSCLRRGITPQSSLRVFHICVFSQILENGRNVPFVTSASNLGVIFKLVTISLLASSLKLCFLFSFYSLLLPDLKHKSDFVTPVFKSLQEFCSKTVAFLSCDFMPLCYVTAVCDLDN